jgi:hypothetical protein
MQTCLRKSFWMLLTPSPVYCREPLCPTHAALVDFLYYHIHMWKLWLNRTERPIMVSEIDRHVNNFLQEEGEHFRLNPRQVGPALTALGFLNRKRTDAGSAR